MRVGVIGCGSISGIYLKNMTSWPQLQVVACADLDLTRAEAAAEQYGVERACSPEQLLRDPDIDIVANLTIPLAHSEINNAALQAGKHVYCEKPLAVTRKQGEETMRLAADKGLKVACAPDTVLGAGLQTCRKLIDEGAIGEAVGANAFMLCHGHETWHPAPEFYYKPGGGPLFDMGPYYLSALVNLLGGVERVNAFAATTFPTRTVTSQPNHSQVVQVETPTHIVGTMRFKSGAIGQITTSFDVWHSELPCIEIYGTEGSVSVPDPNGFGGAVRLRLVGDSGWAEVPLSHAYADNSRGLGVLDLALAVQEKREPRAGGAVAFHVLDVMQSFLESAEKSQQRDIRSVMERQSPMPASGF